MEPNAQNPIVPTQTPPQPIENPIVQEPSFPPPVQNSIPPEQVPPTPPPAVIKNKSPLLGILSVLFFFTALLAAGYFGYQYWKETNMPAPTPTATIEPTPQATEDPTANWETYKNSVLSFELKYPSNLEVVGVGFKVPDITKVKVIAIEKKESVINKTVFVINADQGSNSYSKKSLAEFVNGSFLDNKNNENKFVAEVVSEPYITKFLEYDAYEYSFKGKGFSTGYAQHFGNEGTIDILIFDKNGQFFIIGYYNQEPFNQILSTFKFTNQETDISNWKTYTNKELGFSVSFPTTWEGKYTINKTTTGNITAASFDFIGKTENHWLFSINRVTEEKWQELQNDPQFTGLSKYINTSNGFVYYSQRSIDNPFSGSEGDSYQNMASDITQILSTFKFTN